MTYLLLSQSSYAQIASPNSGKKVRIAIFEAPPALILSESQQPEGMLVDFLNKIGQEENWQIEWIPTEFSEVRNLAQSNKIDLIPFIAYSKSRAQYFDYNAVSFITGWGQVYTHKDEEQVENIFDFADKKISVVQDEIYAIRFKLLCQQFDVKCDLVEVKDYKTAFEYLDKKMVDGAISGNLVGYSYEKIYDIKRTSVVFDPNKVLFATPKGTNQAVLNSIDQYLRTWQQKTTSPYHQIRDKWIGGHETEKLIPNWLLYTLAIGLCLLALSGFIMFLLKRQVHKKTIALEDQTEQMKQIINLVPHLIYAINEEGDIILVNKYAADFFGIQLKDFKNIDKDKLIATQPQSANLFDDEEHLLRKDASTSHKEINTADHNRTNMILKLSKVPFISRQNRKVALVTVGVDITESKLYENQIQHMAQHDALTGLPNRLLLNDRINQSLALSIRENHNAALLFIDLDYFKTINDSIGHSIGDKLLIEVGKRLRELVKEGDTVARLGGDEFIIQLNELDSDLQIAESEACAIAKRINQSIANDYTIEQKRFFMSASIGILLYPKDADEPSLIMQRADTAMYHAKSIGRNCYSVFNKEMENAVIKRHNLENDLRSAITNNQFILEYQPQVAGEEAGLIGVEALIRWNHPERGLIYPNDFIYMAEESDLIVQLGEWVLNTAILQIKAWLNRYGKSPFITVNLSVAQIRDFSLVKTIEKLLQKHQVPARLLELEVTESMLMVEAKTSIAVLNSIKELGVRISIDDFGTGYSSLNYLKKLPLDKLKIDRSFMNDIPGDPDSETIVKTIIGMSYDLGLEVIAEGVETKEQLDFLEQENCRKYQGYYFDRSISAKAIENKYLQPLPPNKTNRPSSLNKA